MRFRRKNVEFRDPGGIAGVESDAEAQRVAHALREFRDTVHEIFDRPDAFWENQRLAVRSRLERRDPAKVTWRRSWAWASATVLLVMGLTLLLDRREPLRPDFAAGDDQQLLLDVERALDRDVPASLEPAALLPEEMFPRVRILPSP